MKKQFYYLNDSLFGCYSPLQFYLVAVKFYNPFQNCSDAFLIAGGETHTKFVEASTQRTQILVRYL